MIHVFTLLNEIKYYGKNNSQTQSYECSYLPLLCSALALDIQVLFSVDSDNKASNAFCKQMQTQILTKINKKSLRNINASLLQNSKGLHMSSELSII